MMREIVKRHWGALLFILAFFIWSGWKNHKHNEFVAENYTLEIVGDLGNCVPCVAKQVVATGGIKSVQIPVVVELEFKGNIIFDLGWPHTSPSLFGRGYETAGSISISIPEDVVIDGKILTANIKKDDLPQHIRNVCF